MPYKVNPTTGQLDYYEVSEGGGGGAAANLAFIPSPTTGTITSDSGTDADIPLANSTNSGLFSPAEKAKLAIALVSVGVSYLGAYNNGADYTYGDVVLYNGVLYERISNPNNPGYPPGTSSWEVFDPLIGSPSFDLWIRNILDNKVNVEAGKGLSTEDYTTAEQTKLAGIAAGAEVNVNADWLATSGDAFILNKPTSLPTANVKHSVKYAVAINKGQAVYVSGADGTNMIVSKADNSSEATSSKTLGLVTATGAANYQGEVITEGLLAGLDTSTATIGDAVWLGTNGNLIFWHYGGSTTKPVAPAHLVFIGIVTRVNANNGEIFVKPQNGFEFDELHDVLISSPVSGQILKLDTDNLWKNWTPNYISGSGTANYIAKFTGSGTIGINSLIYDNGSKIGVGITSPSALFHINNASNADSFLVEDSSNPDSSPFVIDKDGNVGIGNSSPGGTAAKVTIQSSDTEGTVRLGGGNGVGNARLFLQSSATDAYIDMYGNNQYLPLRIDAGPLSLNSAAGSGNVGIGTLTPSAKLDVLTTSVPSTGEILAQFRVSDDINSHLRVINSTGVDSSFIPVIEGKNSGTSVAFGTIGSGTTDTGNTAITIFDSRIGNAPVVTRPLFSWNNYGIPQMLISANGNVGIGTTNPGSKLEVNGDLKVSIVPNATTNTGKILVSDGGVVKYRTAAETIGDILTITTTGSSGPATLTGTTLNIPQYAGGSGSVPESIINSSLIFYANNC